MQSSSTYANIAGFKLGLGLCIYHNFPATRTCLLLKEWILIRARCKLVRCWPYSIVSEARRRLCRRNFFYSLALASKLEKLAKLRQIASHWRVTKKMHEHTRISKSLYLASKQTVQSRVASKLISKKRPTNRAALFRAGRLMCSFGRVISPNLVESSATQVESTQAVAVRVISTGFFCCFNSNNNNFESLSTLFARRIHCAYEHPIAYNGLLCSSVCVCALVRLCVRLHSN